MTTPKELASQLSGLRIFGADDWIWDSKDEKYKSNAKKTFVHLTEVQAKHYIEQNIKENMKLGGMK